MTEIDPNHVHTGDCRRIEIGAYDKTISIVKVCDQPDPYIGGRWTGGIAVYRNDDIELEDLILGAGGVVRVPKSAAFKAQCHECRAMFGRWWRVERDDLMPTEEEVRTRGKDILESYGFVQDGEGWRCPVGGGPSSLLLAEGPSDDPTSGNGRSWPN